jgi:drug/metabolite transporter (DMT)-like permease
MAATAAIVAAESILALTPIAIKASPLDEISAVWSRILTTGVLGYLLTGERSLPSGEWATAASLGLANLLHITTSYESFRNLPAGQAMSLLYTYPLWNLVLGSVFGGEKISQRQFGFMGLAVLGSFLLNTDPGQAAHAARGRAPSAPWGIAMGLIMAFTESVMHTLLRGIGWRDAAKSVWVVNGSASVWLAATQLVSGSVSSVSLKRGGTWTDAALLTGFHGFSLFSGYWLRFYAVPRLSVVTYSILSYAGLLASYLFGFLFMGEQPGWLSLLGMALIIASGLLIQMYAPPDENEAETTAEEVAKED